MRQGYRQGVKWAVGLFLTGAAGGALASPESPHHCNGVKLVINPFITSDGSATEDCPHHPGNYHDDTVQVFDKDTGYHCPPPTSNGHYMTDATAVAVYEINSGTLYDSHAVTGGAIFCILGNPSGKTDKFTGWDEGVNRNHGGDSSLDGVIRIIITWP